MNKIIKQAAKYILIYSVTLSFFIILLTLVSSFHSTWIYDNVKKSAETLLQETNCKEVNVNFKGTKIYIDNHTDALMINTAYSIDNRQPLYSAFVARKNFLPDKTEIIYPDSVGELDFSKKYKKLSQTSELNDIVNGEVLESFEYARYWHGYLTILRPLLIIFDVNSIRMLFRAVFVILAIWLLYLINKKINLITAIVFFIGLTAVDYWYIGISLQGSFVFFIMMISSIIILLRYKKIKEFPILFFEIGMLTSFFDFLTVPILTLGIPLILYFLLVNKVMTIKEIFKNMIFISLAWGFGYVLSWIGKWTLLKILYDKNIFATVINQIIYRASNISYENEIKYINILIDNYQWVVGAIGIGLITLYIMFTMKFLFRKNLKMEIHKNKSCIPFLVIAIIPFIWYALIENHSYNHSFFTYRNLLLTIIGVLISITKMIEWRNLNDENNRKFKDKRKGIY